jgi:SpoVK/Ycf46/Vps4 family AAA+-type ATPase
MGRHHRRYRRSRARSGDRPAREAIVAVHLRGKPVADRLQLADLTEQTDGMSAAEIRFICDSAAMSALRRVFPISATAAVDPAAVVDRTERLRRRAAQREGIGEGLGHTAVPFIKVCNARKLSSGTARAVNPFPRRRPVQS